MEAGSATTAAGAAASAGKGPGEPSGKEARVELWRQDEVVGVSAALYEKVEPFCLKKAELSVISVTKIVGGKGTFYPVRCVDIHSREVVVMHVNEKQVGMLGLSNGMREDVEDAYATVEAGGTSKAGYPYGPKIKISAYPYERPHGKGTLGDYAKLRAHALPNGQIRCALRACEEDDGSGRVGGRSLSPPLCTLFAPGSTRCG